MKKVLFILAAAAVMLAGCVKENTEKNKISFNKDTADLNVAFLAKSGMNHQVNGPGYHFDADFILGGVNCHVFLNIAATAKDKKTDLGKYVGDVAYNFEINSSAEAGYPFDIHQYNTEYSGGELSHSSVGTWFKSGTMELKDNGKEVLLNVNGVLQDGRNFKLNIQGPYEYAE